MKYNINDKVCIRWETQIIKAQVIKRIKTWFGNRYLLYFSVSIIDNGIELYKNSNSVYLWERQIISKVD